MARSSRILLLLALASPLLAGMAGPAGAQGACSSSVRVAPGDTLHAISRRCGIPAEVIRQANPDIDWRVLRIGQAVSIPQPEGRGREVSEPRRGEDGAGRRGPGGDIYRIERGDSLSSIAALLGITVEALLDANPGLDERALQPGREIRLRRDDDFDRDRPRREAQVTVDERFVEPGGVATIRVTGFAPRAPITIRSGPAGGRLVTEDTGRLGRDGELVVEIDIPRRARAGERWMVEAESRSGRSARAGFRIAERAPERLKVTGLITTEGVECPALRAVDGTLYTLSGRLRGYRPGDRVTVTGRIADLSTCQQGRTIEVDDIEEAE